MIWGTLDRLPEHSRTGSLAQALDFFRQRIEPGRLPDGKHELLGRDLYWVLMTFTPKPREAAILETHREYVDVHVTLEGEERVVCFDRSGLEVTTPYNPEKDAEFYRDPGTDPCVLRMGPGVFALFGPRDAHLTQMAPEGCGRIRKAVLKVRRRLLP